MEQPLFGLLKAYTIYVRRIRGGVVQPQVRVELHNGK